MSQQEMNPEGQQHVQEEDAEILAQPYYWSTTPKSGSTGHGPKNEHPSTFEESISTYDGYHAQNIPYVVDAEPNTRSTRADELGEDARQRQEAARRQQQQQQEAFRSGLSPDGDAFEYGYRPYRNTAQSQVPPWARPQPGNRRAFRWLIFIVLAFVFAKPLLIGAGILVGITAFAILLPIIIILALIVVFSIFALIALRVLGVPIRPRGLWRGLRSYRRQRRTWRR